MPLDLFPYQEVGASFLAQRKRAGLHDEMGIGKTPQIIRAQDDIGAERIWVIAPAMLRENWVREVRRFSRRQNMRWCTGRTIHDYIAWQRGRFHAMVTSYELATKWMPRLMDNGEILDNVTTDEGHYCKNPDTKRTRAIHGDDLDGIGGVMGWAETAWNATGTPIPNDPIDIFVFLKFCGVMPLTKAQFMRRYFYARKTAFGSRQTVLPEMIPELQALIENNSLRRTSAQVGLELPPIWLTTTLVDGDTKPILDLLKEHPGLDGAIIQALEQGGLSFLDAQHIATLRRLVGEAKAVPYAHMICNELMSGELDKLVVIGMHREALKTVQQFCLRRNIDARLVLGGVPDKTVQQHIDDFQNHPETRVILVQIKKGGTGLTLTAACNIDMLESGWSPESNAQAIKRVHRIGQDNSVRARFITLADSIDEAVVRVVVEKTSAIADVEGFAMITAPEVA